MTFLSQIVAPMIFVILWSSAFIAAKFGVAHVEPFTFLTSRFGFVTVIFAAMALAARAPWPRSPRAYFDIAVVGLFLHAFYLSSVFIAIRGGMPSGLVALVSGLQPVLTAVAAGLFLGEPPSIRQWVGCFVGFAGMVLVLSDRISVEGVTLLGIGFSVLALVSISFGTLYQKRNAAKMNLLTGNAVMAATGCLVTLAGAALFETMQLVWEPAFIGAFLWLSLAVSLGAFSLLMMLIKHGQATKVASLFYLVPPTAAVMAYIAFGEEISVLAGIGILVTAGGVAMVVLPQAKRA
ncbi:MAG: DMT family transporter [Nisaea sp.]|jgi:drug/metabolite transporter (DMT)-like permease|uniref:DMT family transporter n=1 Tax=Nisaea sp. TaxID=2024842 RepID=UPI001B1DE3E7|nr:DMT family transporter [Nisaea sp.]MBO6559552.1 DMT family transporter [Nisaea sp.]